MKLLIAIQMLVFALAHSISAAVVNGLSAVIQSSKAEITVVDIETADASGQIPIGVMSVRYALRYGDVSINISDGMAVMYDPINFDTPMIGSYELVVDGIQVDWVICGVNTVTCGIYIVAATEPTHCPSSTFDVTRSVYFSITGKDGPEVAAAINEVVMSSAIRIGNQTEYTYIQNHPIKDCIKELVEKLEKLKPSVPPMQKNDPAGQP